MRRPLPAALVAAFTGLAVTVGLALSSPPETAHQTARSSPGAILALGGTGDPSDPVDDAVELAFRAEADRLEAELREAERLAEEERVRQEEAARAEAARRATIVAPRSVPSVVPWDGSIHSHPWMICTRRHESDSGDANGNGLHDAGYQAIGGGGTFRGAYQFMRSTWDSTARMAGRDDLIGVDPAEASVADQDQMAWTLSNGGTNKGPWGGRC